MSKLNTTIFINKPIQEVFDYAATPLNGPAFIPNLNENTNIIPEKAEKGQTFDWRYTMNGIDLRGKSEVTEFDPPHKVTIHTTGDSNTDWAYTFTEEDQGTKVNLDINYEINESFLKKMANSLVLDKINQRSAEASLENLKTILEG